MMELQLWECLQMQLDYTQHQWDHILQQEIIHH